MALTEEDIIKVFEESESDEKETPLFTHEVKTNKSKEQTSGSNN